MSTATSSLKLLFRHLDASKAVVKFLNPKTFGAFQQHRLFRAGPHARYVTSVAASVEKSKQVNVKKNDDYKSFLRYLKKQKEVSIQRLISRILFSLLNLIFIHPYIFVLVNNVLVLDYEDKSHR